MTQALKLFAATPRGMESLLAEELGKLGADDIIIATAGVSFTGSLETAYRVCLWSRLANRVLLSLTSFQARTPEELYAGIQAIDWDGHLDPAGTLAVDVNIARSRIKHTHFAALKVKDAIVDQMRERHGMRPSVDTERPDLRLNVYLLKNEAQVSLDLSGESLHRRGYRTEGGRAPLKENLAAAILLLAGWPQSAAAGGTLLDPMCGSGTLLIEGALMAADIAPGLLRDYFGFIGWHGHDPEAWARLRAEAEERRTRGLAALPRIAGFDRDPDAVTIARANAQRAGLAARISFERDEMQRLKPGAMTPGLLIANPPYGERLGQEQDLRLLYRQLGQMIRGAFTGWRAALFSCNPRLLGETGLYAGENFALHNGALECRLASYATVTAGAAKEIDTTALTGSEGAQMFANRLRKNLRHLGRWARRSDVACYRLYDADLPEYALAVDLYQGEGLWVHAQEYQAPDSIDPSKASLRLQEALAVIGEVLEIPSGQIFLKQRRRQKGSAQYEKFDERGEFHIVQDGAVRCRVNFSDYLDTGLFLDHRLTRAMLGGMAQGRRFLNLFAYTGVASVHAALGGARSTTTVDMSATYLDWAQRNMALNGCTGHIHRFIQADCLKWIQEQQRNPYERFELIFLDPPTFSTSKRMETTFDVQRDHVDLLRDVSALLAPRGVLIFSNNLRKFKMQSEALPELDIRDITVQTIPEDYARNPRIHNCWRITRRADNINNEDA